MLLSLTACGTLESGGKYEGSRALYTTDTINKTSHDILDAFLRWERDNRMSLWQLAPDIKHATDAIRDKAPHAFVAYDSARSLYLLFPTKDNQAALMDSTAALESLVVDAQTITLKFKK